MDARDFLSIAGRLTLARESGAADYRTAISRAYYAAYHLARQFLNYQKFRCIDDNEHLWVQRHFYNCQFPAAREIGRVRSNLHEARKGADYDLADASCETLAQARFQLERAHEIISRLQICAEAANLGTVRAEILAYRAKANVR